MPKLIHQIATLTMAALIWIAATGVTFAQTYGYTIVARPGQVIGGKTIYRFLSGPSLNNAGEIVFRATLDSAGQETGVFTGSRLVAASGQVVGGRLLSGVFGNVSINNLGQVAYVGLSASTGTYDGVFVDSSRVVAAGQTIGGVEIVSFSDPILNDAGQLLFIGNAARVMTPTSFLAFGLGASMNNAGQVVYATHQASIAGIGLSGVTYGPGSVVDGKTLFATLDARAGVIGSPSINNAGQIAFLAAYNGGSSPGLFASTTGGVRLLAQSGQSIGGSTLGSISALSINDTGTIAFSGGGASGIFTQNTVVFRTGDIIEGRTVSGVGAPAINSSGQIAFGVTFSDGASAIVLATPGGGGGGGTSSVTINTAPAGQSVVVDGQTYTAPQTFSWTAGSSHTLGAPSPQGSGGTQYVFQNWSNGGAPSQTVTAPGTATTFTANFTTQHQLTTSVGTGGSAAGTIGPSSGFVNAGTSTVVTATANPGYVFTGFSGDLSGLTNPQTLTINLPRSVVANFRSTAASIGTVLSLTGVATANGIALSKGSAVYANDVLETAATSALGIVFINGAALTLSENSKVTVDKFVIDNPNPDLREIVLSMLTGAMRWVGGALSPPVPHGVKTPAAYIGIRGTDFIARYSAGRLTVDLISGIVDVTPNQAPTLATFTGPVTIVSDGLTPSNAPLTSAQYTQLKTQVFPASPVVTSFRVLFGTQSYDLTGSARVRVPWQITGVQMTFSLPITVANAASLGGITATGFAGLGTNTLTWSVAPIALGDLTLALAGTGLSAITGSSGVALESGAGASQRLKVLWGDFTDDGAVSSADLVGVNNARVAPYNLFADANGDGAVTVADVAVIRSRIGAVLP